MAVGYKLAKEYHRSGPIRFGGIPGVYSKDEAQSLDALGVDEKDMTARIKAAGLTDTLVKVTNAPKADPPAGGPAAVTATEEADK